LDNRVTIEEALDYCLENPDGLSPQELLDMFPAYRDELAPLLGIGAGIASVSPPHVPFERRAAMKARLMDAAAASILQSATGMAGHDPISLEDARKVRKAYRKGGANFFAIPSWVAAAVLVLAFVWWAASASLPDGPFYPVKLASENVMLTFQGSPEGKARANVDLANARLYDLRTMQQQGKLAQAAAAFDNYNLRIVRAGELWSDLEAAPKVEVGKVVYVSALAGGVTFEGFGGYVSQMPTAINVKMTTTEAVLLDLQGRSSGVLVAAGINPTDVVRSFGLERPALAALLTPVAPGAAVSTGTSSEPSLATVVAAQATVSAQISALETLAAGNSSTPGVSAARTVLAGASGTPLAGAGQTVTSVAADATSTSVAATRTAIQQIPSSTPTLRPSNTPRPRVTPPRATPTPPRATPSPPRRVRTATPTRPAATRTPVRPSPTPTLAPSSTPTTTMTTTSTSTPSATVTAVPVPTDTALPPAPTVCDLRVADVDASCSAPDCATWIAHVTNNASSTVRASWEAVIEVKVAGSSGFQSFETVSGESDFAPGDNTISGSCLTVPENTEKYRVKFSLDTSGGGCNVADKRSQEKLPCALPEPTTEPPPPRDTPVHPGPDPRDTPGPPPHPTLEPRPTRIPRP
jgi:hypothetical protein